MAITITGYHHHAGYYGAYASEYYAHERLPDPSPQYYYVNQGPTYSGPATLRRSRPIRKARCLDGAPIATPTPTTVTTAAVTPTPPIIITMTPGSGSGGLQLRTAFAARVARAHQLRCFDDARRAPRHEVKPQHSLRRHVVARSMRHGSMQGMRTDARNDGERSNCGSARRPLRKRSPVERRCRPKPTDLTTF